MHSSPLHGRIELPSAGVLLMGLFSKITDRIFGRKAAEPAPPPAAAKPDVVIFDGSKDDPDVAPPALLAEAPPAPAPEPVDGEAVLTAIEIGRASCTGRVQSHGAET